MNQINDRRIDFNAKRTVTPRKSAYVPLSIIAVDIQAETVWTESTERTYPLGHLPALVLQEPDSILVGYEVGLAVEQIVKDFEKLPTFQVRVTPIDRELSPWEPNKEKRVVNHGVSWSFIGWRRSVNKKAGWLKKHFPVDPFLFTASFKREYKTADRSLAAVIGWAEMVREFLEENDLAFRATQTGIAAQLLRDPRFYPEARRKVPKATNALARNKLPGNLYVHNANRLATYDALEVDQQSSHHSCARDLVFPCSNTLYAKGYFRTLEDKPFAMRGTRFFDKLISQPGLFYAKLRVPRLGPNRSLFVTPNADNAGTDQDGCRVAFVYSNELDELKRCGVEILYLIAAWTSKETDTGLNRYAEWSLSEIEKCDADRKRWMKPLLLSGYGLLATKPRKMQAAYLRGKGKQTHYHIGRGRVMRFFKYESANPHEPGFVNVIQRGMIEAETRLRSLQMARFLESHGCDVLLVYADAVFVSPRERQLPLLPPGWTTQEITNAYFPNANQVVCDQFAKIPGHTGRQRRIYIDEIKGKREAPITA